MASLSFAELPPALPIFPLEGALLLPGGQLPLNIFEPRYKAMIEDAMGSQRLIGMIQPKVKERIDPDDKPELYGTGCAGKITAFSETGDGRFLVNLTGICRFGIKREVPMLRGYRRIEPEWARFAADLEPPCEQAFNRGAVLGALKTYLARNNYGADWKAVESTDTPALVVLLAAMCPFSPGEKQALLEASTPERRAHVLISLLAMGGGHTRGERPKHVN